MIRQVIHDFREYLRAYWVYVSTSVGFGKASAVALMWVAGIFVPLGANTFLPLPVWLRLAWMAGWGLLSYICAPFGMWKHHRAQISSWQRCGLRSNRSANRLEPPADLRREHCARRHFHPPNNFLRFGAVLWLQARNSKDM
jgi:hypothetical protein